MEVAKNMDTVFADCSEEDLEFDVFFDQEDSLIDTVIGVKENGDPLTGVDFEELHQTDEDVDQKDIKDELGPDSEEYNMGSKEAEGTDKKKLDIDQELDSLEKNGESDADKELGLDKLDDEYQDGKADGKAPTADTVTPTVEKEIKEDAAEIIKSLSKLGYKIVKEDDEELLPEEEDRDAADTDLDPVSNPSDNGSGEEAPVADIPSDEGEAQKEAPLEGKPESKEDVSVTAECGDVDSMIQKMQAMGYTVTKKEEQEPEAAATASEDECGATCNAADDVTVSAEPDENDVAKDLVDALAKQGYKIVKADQAPEEGEEPAITSPVVEEEEDIPADDNAEIPATGDDAPEVDIPAEECDDPAVCGDDEECEQVVAKDLVDALAKQGYKIVKADEEAEEPADEGCKEAAEVSVEGSDEKPSDIDSELDPNQDVAPECDDNYNATDDASVKEDTDIDSVLDADEDLDDEALEEVEDDDADSLELTYDPSDEDLIDIALNK